jgi:hypothetical protein
MTDPKEGRGFRVSDPTQASGDLPRIDFSTFVLSLAASGLLHLGRTPPVGGETEPVQLDLPLARQSIDTLEMIQEKTRGNLEEEESKLLQGVLYELRMEYVRVEREQK